MEPSDGGWEDSPFFSGSRLSAFASMQSCLEESQNCSVRLPKAGPSEQASQTVRQLFHGPAPRSPLHLLASKQARSGSNSCSVGAGRGEGRAHVMRKKGRTTEQVCIQEAFKDSSILAEDAGPQRGPATARTCTSAQRVAMSPSKLPEHPLDMRDSARQGHQGHTYVLKGKGLEYCRL